jgi:hypothetical protein
MHILSHARPSMHSFPAYLDDYNNPVQECHLPIVRHYDSEHYRLSFAILSAPAEFSIKALIINKIDLAFHFDSFSENPELYIYRHFGHKFKLFSAPVKKVSSLKNLTLADL